MDGLNAVTARVRDIQALVGSFQAPARGTGAVAGGVATGAVARVGGGTGADGASGMVGRAAGSTGSSWPAASSSPASASSTAFSAALQQARAVQPGGAAGGGLNADGVPVELARHGNGRIPSDALSSIGVSGHKLWDPAATAFTAMRAEAKAAGVTIGVTDSYRSYEGQVDVARRKGLYSEGGLAAKPGTSDHGWGRSLDLDLDSKAQSWMRTNAGRFGYVEDVPREPWHWTFTPTS